MCCASVISSYSEEFGVVCCVLCCVFGMSQTVDMKAMKGEVVAKKGEVDSKSDEGQKKTKGAERPWSCGCAMLVGDSVVGGEKFGGTTRVEMKLWSDTMMGVDPWMGIELAFPLGESNEDDVFGQCHESKSLDQRMKRP